MGKNTQIKRYNKRLYIFPSLIPLIEILPWLLTFVGSLATMVTALKAYIANNRRKLLLYGAFTLCILFIGSVYMYGQYQNRFENTGSHLVKTNELPVFIKEIKHTKTVQDGSSILTSGWSANIYSPTLSTPVLTDDLILMGTFGKKLEARHRYSGELHWSLKKRHPIYSQPVVHNNIIYVGEGLHMADYSGLTAISYDSQDILWERRFPSHIQSYPIFDPDDDRLFIGGGATGLWALDKKKGTKLWRAEIGHIDSAPLLHKDTLYAAAKTREDQNGSQLHSISPASGNILWSFEIEGNPMSDVKMINKTSILLSSANGQIGLNKRTDAGWVQLINIKDANPKIIWKTQLGTMAMPDGALSENKSTAFYALKNGQVWALNTKNGDVLWVRNCGKEFRSNLTYLTFENRELILATTFNGLLHILDANTGQIMKQVKTAPAGSYAAPVFKDNIIYITTPYALKTYDATELLKL